MLDSAAQRRAWVRFDDGSVKVITLLEEPEEGKELLAVNLEGRWIATNVALPTTDAALRGAGLYDVRVEARPA
jgi:hypothetical protein